MNMNEVPIFDLFLPCLWEMYRGMALVNLNMKSNIYYLIKNKKKRIRYSKYFKKAAIHLSVVH